VFAVFCSCALTRAPQGFLENPYNLQAEVFGGWIELDCFTGSHTNPRMHLAGELLALSPDSLFMVDEALHAIALSHIINARLESYLSNADAMAGLVILGMVSTLSNGFALIFTAPMWLIGGSISASSRSYEPILEYPKHDWNRFSQFARYPQGLPDKINRKEIKIKSCILF
jgi:hypothetical protein